MLINLRNALMSGKRLPYDAEIEFLESTGTQYIDAGFATTGVGLEVDVLCERTSSYTREMGIVGRTVGDGFELYSQNAVCGLWNSQGGRSVASSVSFTANTPHQIHAAISSTGAILTVDGTTNTATFTPTSGTTGNCLVFTHKKQYWFIGRIYSCKIWQNGVLVRDFIPVRKGAVGYLYDRVSGKLFGNAGTGDFVLGPDVVPVEWLGGTGTQYINTGVVPDNTTGAIARFLVENLSSFNYVLGSRGTSSGRFYLYNNEFSTTVQYGWGTMKTTNTEALPNQPIKASLNYLNDRKYIYNNEQLGVLSDVNFSGNTYPMYLFNSNFAGSAVTSDAPLVGKIFDGAISKGSTIVRSFRPVRVGTGSTWEGAMMDVLTRRIYRNAGTGAFTYGNDLKYPIPAE